VPVSGRRSGGWLTLGRGTPRGKDQHACGQGGHGHHVPQPPRVQTQLVHWHRSFLLTLGTARTANTLHTPTFRDAQFQKPRERKSHSSEEIGQSRRRERTKTPKRRKLRKNRRHPSAFLFFRAFALSCFRDSFPYGL
jgi:hypothetical protein